MEFLPRHTRDPSMRDPERMRGENHAEGAENRAVGTLPVRGSELSPPCVIAKQLSRASPT